MAKASSVQPGGTSLGTTSPAAMTPTPRTARRVRGGTRAANLPRRVANLWPSLSRPPPRPGRHSCSRRSTRPTHERAMGSGARWWPPALGPCVLKSAESVVHGGARAPSTSSGSSTGGSIQSKRSSMMGGPRTKSASRDRDGKKVSTKEGDRKTLALFERWRPPQGEAARPGTPQPQLAVSRGTRARRPFSTVSTTACS
jgi:hypothetical protein